MYFIYIITVLGTCTLKVLLCQCFIGLSDSCISKCYGAVLGDTSWHGSCGQADWTDGSSFPHTALPGKAYSMVLDNKNSFDSWTSDLEGPEQC